MRCKPLYSIICLLLVAFLFSCSKNAVEFDEQLSNTRALLSIDLTQNAGEEQVAIKTVRFVIFGNASSSIPYLDVNEFHEEATPLETTDIKAVIEVKGTCFLIKQNNPSANEITLFNGSIEFNVESTQHKIEMKPLQELVYNPADAGTQLRQIENIEWQNGRYNFTQFNLEHLTRIINQMYGSRIIISDKVNKNCAFTGSIRYDESLEDVIDKICFSLNLRKKEINHEIIIYN